MIKKIKYLIAKIAGKAAISGIKLGKGMGKSFPGHLFLRIASYDGLKELAKNPKFGSILITGTNGKTTTTKLLIKLMEKEYKLAYNYESNTINAITTGLLNSNSDFGIFEYGIRDVKHGIPDKIQEFISPVGVVYTNISREHSQVAGVKNKFEDYIFAKSLLIKNMKEGIIISNGNNPYTTYVTEEKIKKDSNNLKINYFTSSINLESMDKMCPYCFKPLQYEISEDDIFYNCECGFSKVESDVQINEVEITKEKWSFKVSGNPYNYFLKKHFKFEFECNFPSIGSHNINNSLTAITTYASFTHNISNFKNNVQDVFRELDKGILPPGRFEIFNIENNNKTVGLGQGDNGEALNVNVQFMQLVMENDNLHFIYTSPDDYEEDIFKDHLKIIKKANPVKISVLPGRESVKMAKYCYDILKESYNVCFYPIEELNNRIIKIHEIILSSDADYVIASGCGEEQRMWESIKENVKEIIK
ncbi:MAG: UDP-N-acetylmuramyl peptide synthase [Methanobrevibacter sp.]|nr:UDP-N-acetylmuramyl peptide synthase [Methanobrevibacter sp.]